jgi:transposase
MDSRELKALEIAARSKITFAAGVFTVLSQSGRGDYKVILTTNDGTCTCEDFQLRGKACKHILACRIVLERECGAASLPIDTDVLPKKPTYKQNWPLYDLAQQTEKDRFQILLFDLCKGIAEPARAKTGRPRTPLADQVFSAVFKVYCTLSARRFMCDLKEAYKRGYIQSLMNSVTVCAYLEDEALTPILKNLIIQSSLCLRTVETTLIPDSSGFSTSKFVCWMDEKYGTMKSGRAWVKAHAMCGAKTNIVTTVEILDMNAADCPQFKTLVETTVQSGFNVQEVPADKAYLSRDNLELVEQLGGTAFVPFKINSAPGEEGSLWEKLFHYYQFRKDEFLKHYHQRSNMESTFSMVKAKFQDYVRSKVEVAQKNEVLCKFLCHNICVVHQSHIELGIEPVFWKNEISGNDDHAVILPLAH